jgi:hypothetical protein
LQPEVHKAHGEHAGHEPGSALSGDEPPMIRFSERVQNVVELGAVHTRQYAA